MHDCLMGTPFGSRCGRGEGMCFSKTELQSVIGRMIIAVLRMTHCTTVTSRSPCREATYFLPQLNKERNAPSVI
jgi:hypothetical protein